MSVARRRDLIAFEHSDLPVIRQCELVSISRSAFYYTPVGESPLNLALMRLIDEQFMETPFYGTRQTARHLRRCGYCVGRKRVRRLMARMGLAAVYQKPRTSVPHPEHAVFPYLLRDLVIDRPNQVWSTDITYIPMRRGFFYLVAVMDWATRKVLSWRISNTMEADFCIAALEDAIERFGAPEIFNSDSGKPVHLSAVCPRAASRGHTGIDGRSRPMAGQCLHRAALAVVEIRVCISARLRDEFRTPGWRDEMGRPV
jgi:putative transposase